MRTFRLLILFVIFALLLVPAVTAQEGPNRRNCDGGRGACFFDSDDLNTPSLQWFDPDGEALLAPIFLQADDFIRVNAKGVFAHLQDHETDFFVLTVNGQLLTGTGRVQVNAAVEPRNPPNPIPGDITCPSSMTARAHLTDAVTGEGDFLLTFIQVAHKNPSGNCTVVLDDIRISAE